MDRKLFTRLVRDAGLEDPTCPLDQYEYPEIEELVKLVVFECILAVQLKIMRNGNTPENERSRMHIHDLLRKFDVTIEEQGEYVRGSWNRDE